MSDLRSERISPVSHPFSYCGVDFSGAASIKCTDHRATKFNKSYVAFFVCFSTKAVHLELVGDLSTEGFIACFQRFISRRGLPHSVWSDNGTNFSGFANLLLDQPRIHKMAVTMGIRWKFIAARSPHQGGLWEAAVKAGKSILLRAIGDQVLTREEFTTILAKVEAILNSRPLCRIKSNESYEPFTPAHFLIGQTFNDIPLEESNYNRLSRRYELQQSIIKGFWNRWVLAYLNQLQPRSRWKTSHRNLKVNDLVLIRSSSPVLKWLMGRVTEVYPDVHGDIRTVSIITPAGQVFKRSVQQVVRVPVEDSGSSASARGEQC